MDLLLYAGLGLALGLKDRVLGLGLGYGFAGLVTSLENCRTVWCEENRMVGLPEGKKVG